MTAAGLRTVVAIVSALAAASVATDWPPVGPTYQPPVRQVPDRCSMPRTLAESHDVLGQLLDPDVVRQIARGTESDAAALNVTIGPVLRNIWGLWNGSPLRDHLRTLGLQHPDDMSALVLVTFWRSLRDQPLRAEDEVRRLLSSTATAKPEPRCRCLLNGSCRTVQLLDRRWGRDRGFVIWGCCCLQVPQVIEGRPEFTPGSDQFFVVPPASSFDEQACGPRFGVGSTQRGTIPAERTR